MELPPLLRQQYSCVLLQTSPHESMVAASVRLGQPLNMEQLKALHGHYRFPLPPPKHGSGKKGGIVKQDYAEALVNHFFKDKVDKADFESMVSGIMGRKIKHLDPSGSKRHADDILRAFEGLETEDQPDFVPLVQIAQDENILKKAREDRAPRSVDLKKGEQQHVTPSVLRDLCPVGGRLNRHPQLKRYQGFISGTDPGTGTSNLIR